MASFGNIMISQSICGMNFGQLNQRENIFMQIYENNTHLLGIGCKNFYELNTTVFCIFVEIAFVIQHMIQTCG